MTLAAAASAQPSKMRTRYQRWVQGDEYEMPSLAKC